VVSKFNNNQAKESSMWEEFTEPQTVKYSDLLTKTWDKLGIKREDGFSIIRVGIDREKWETFICRGNFGEFKFYAVRWDCTEDKPIDTYTVKVNIISGDWQTDKETHRKLLLSHAKDIDSALRAFPIGKTYEGIPVTDVLFNISINPKVPHLVHAEEI
jgi:hypothetical protein